VDVAADVAAVVVARKEPPKTKPSSTMTRKTAKSQSPAARSRNSISTMSLLR